MAFHKYVSLPEAASFRLCPTCPVPGGAPRPPLQDRLGPRRLASSAPNLPSPSEGLAEELRHRENPSGHTRERESNSAPDSFPKKPGSRKGASRPYLFQASQNPQGQGCRMLQSLITECSISTLVPWSPAGKGGREEEGRGRGRGRGKERGKKGMGREEGVGHTGEGRKEGRARDSRPGLDTTTHEVLVPQPSPILVEESEPEDEEVGQANSQRRCLRGAPCPCRAWPWSACTHPRTFYAKCLPSPLRFGLILPGVGSSSRR